MDTLKNLTEIERRVMYARGFLWATIQEDSSLDATDTAAIKDNLLDAYNHLSSSMFALKAATDLLKQPTHNQTMESTDDL